MNYIIIIHLQFDFLSVYSNEINSNLIIFFTLSRISCRIWITLLWRFHACAFSSNHSRTLCTSHSANSYCMKWVKTLNQGDQSKYANPDSWFIGKRKIIRRWMAKSIDRLHFSYIDTIVAKEKTNGTLSLGWT